MSGRAMRLERPARVAARPVQLVELPDPRPDPGELILRVAACGVCRTDLQIVEGDLGARRLPIIPGHQVVGRVEALGEGVSGWRVGERAGVAWLAGADGTCVACLRGRENLCPNAIFTGWDRDGGYAERVSVRADFAFRLPEGFTDLEPFVGELGHSIEVDGWWERSIRSVANFTREDAREFLALAAEIPIRTQIERFPLEDANVALARLADARIAGAAVIEMRP